MSTPSAASSQEIARRDALAERLFTGLLETMELLTVQLGVKLGLYACLHRDGPATAGSWPIGRVSTRATPGNGSNSRPRPESSTPARTPIRRIVGSRYPPVTPRPCSIGTARRPCTPSHRRWSAWWASWTRWRRATGAAAECPTPHSGPTSGTASPG